MALRVPSTVVGKNDMKLRALAVVAMAVIASGCGVSEKSPSPDYIAKASANRRDAVAGSNNVTPAFDDPAETHVNNDFDLLEEEISHILQNC